MDGKKKKYVEPFKTDRWSYDGAVVFQMSEMNQLTCLTSVFSQ